MTPELPNPVSLGVGYFDEYIFGHTKEQLIEYGKLCAAAAREECAEKVKQDLYPDDENYYVQQYNAGILRLAEKIRSGT